MCEKDQRQFDLHLSPSSVLPIHIEWTLPSFQIGQVYFHLWIIGVRVVFFSSPEASGSQGELIVYPYSGVHCRRQ